MSFADDLGAQIVAAHLGTINTDLFSGANAVIPTGDGPYTTIIETGGQAPTRTQDKASASTRRPSAQIVVRAASRGAARAKSEALFTALDGIFNTTVNGVFYLSITARQDPTDMGVDPQKRALVVFNLLAEKAP